MDETKESFHACNSLLDEKSQFECETINKLPLKSMDDCLNISDEIGVENNELCNMKRSNQIESIHFDKGEVNVQGNTKILTEESACKNTEQKAQLESTLNSKEAIDSNNINATFNESTVSDISSSDKEILQSRQPVQNNVHEDEQYSLTKSTSITSISDKETTVENYSEITKRPIIIQATVCSEKEYVDCKISDTNLEINKKTKSEYQETGIDKTNFSFSNVEIDNSLTENESTCIEKLTSSDLNFDERRDENEIFLEEEMTDNDVNLYQNTKEMNDLCSDSIIEDFLNGSFDINTFKPEKNSTMIKDKTITDQNQEIKEKQSRNIANFPADSTFQLKRKTSEKQTEDCKKIRTEKNKNEDRNISVTLNKVKTKSENKYSKVRNQDKRVNKQLKCNDRKQTALNNFDKKEENSKKNKMKRNVTQTKINKNEEVVKDFSWNITPFKKSRNLRNSSLIASKKIKEIEKLENSESFEEDLLDSDAPYLNTFHNENIDIILLDDFQPFGKEEKMESNKIARSNRKRKNKIEDILDACFITEKKKLEIDNVKTQLSGFFEKENEAACENHHNKKKAINRQQRKDNKRTENEVIEQNRNINIFTNFKSDAINKNYGAITQSKTWEMLEKELLGELNDKSFSNNTTESFLIKERAVKKQNTKDVHLHSSKSVMNTVSMPVKRNKYDEKYEIQNIEKKNFENPTKACKNNDIVASKSKNIVKKTIEAMERCTARFTMSKEHFTGKERINNELEFNDIIYDMNSDQEAEFHSNMTFVTNKSKQYYKNEIVTILKQSSSMKNEKSSRNAIRASYKNGKYKQNFSDVSIVTESYLVEDKEDDNLKTESHTLIPSSNKNQNDPWCRLIKELNLEQCNNENKNKVILNERQNRKSFYHENLKQYKNQNKDEKQKFIMNLNKREFGKQDKNESKLEVLEQFAFDKTVILSNCTATCSNLNVEDSYTNNAFGIDNDAKSWNKYKTEKIPKPMYNVEIKEKKTLPTKEIKKLPKYKIQVEDDGSMKFKQCRSLSSSSGGSEKQKEERAEQGKFLKNQQKTGRDKYKKYLSNLFERKEKLKEDVKTIESMTGEKSSKRNLVTDKTEEKGKMETLLIAKNDDDVFSISSSSSSDSEAVNKGTGLLCDMFDE